MAQVTNDATLSERRLVIASDNKYQLSLTNQRDALHHGKRAVNKGGRLYPVYTIQPVVKLLNGLNNRMDNWFDNQLDNQLSYRLYRVNGVLV